MSKNDGDMKTRRVMYIGSDSGYWANVVHRFKSTYPHQNFDFKVIKEVHEDEINLKINEIMSYDPQFIYIDLSVKFDTVSKLGLYLKRLNHFKYIPISGLVENETKIEMTLYSGFNFIFIKGAETHDVVYHPFFYIFPREALKQDFAFARFRQPTILTEKFRIGYFTPEFMHVESNATWNVGDIVKLNTFISRDYNKSDFFEVKSRSTQGLYYDFKYCYDLAYKFLDDITFDDSEFEAAAEIADQELRQKTITRIEDDRKQKIAEHEQSKESLRKAMKDWVNSLKDSKQAKKTKVLIVDKTLDFLKSEKRKLDSFSYTIRLQTDISEEFRQVEQYLPQLIAFSIPELDIDESEVELTEEEKESAVKSIEIKLSEFFKSLVDKSKSIKGYNPFIIIFNCKTLTSKSFQDSFKYDLIMANKDKMNFDLVLQMAELFEKKQEATINAKIDQKIIELRKEDPSKFGRLTRNDFIESRYHVSKKNELSKGNFIREVELKGINESEVYFLCDQELALVNYYLENPFKMVVSLVPQDGKSAQKQNKMLLYKGLIHSIGENEKKKLRQFVNEIYTAHKIEQRKAEEEAFKAMNKSESEDLDKSDNE